MLMPKRVKHRKQMRGKRRGNTKGGANVAFGEYGLKALDRGWITNRQIEAARVAMTRKIKRGGKVWINVFPDKPYTKKPAETRQGSGKGNPEGWVAVVKPGKVMFELAGVARGPRQGGDAPRRPQAADQDQVRHPRGGRTVKAGRRRTRSATRTWSRRSRRRARRPSTCAFATPPASSRTPPGSAPRGATWPG